MTEHELQQNIRLALGKHGIVLRLNVGKVRTEDGRYLTTGLPPGTSDLLFIGDGRAVFIISIHAPRVGSDLFSRPVDA